MQRDPAVLSEDEAGPPVLRGARPNRRLRWSLPLLGIILVTGLVAALLVGVIGTIRRDLLAGREAMEAGRDHLIRGEAEAAERAFGEGERRFSNARSRADGLLLDVVGWVPVAGRSVDVVRAVASSGVDAARAGGVLAESVDLIPGGIAGLAPVGGAVPVDRIQPIADAARTADELLTRARDRVVQSPETLLIGEVASARREAEEQLRELSNTTHAAALVLDALPGFLGAQEPRRYFFGAQNPAELRGTGGLIGAYSILSISDGHFSFSSFRPIHGLPIPDPGTVEPPNADYAENYEPFRRGSRFWTAINIMPDFPSVAEAILDSYEAVTSDRLDGVIVSDPFALEALLEATGPVELGRYGIRVDADSVVRFTANEAYAVFDDSSVRKRILGDVAKGAFEAFVTQPSADLARLRLLLDTAGNGHIQVYSDDPGMQEGLRATPVGGALVRAADAGDTVSVVVSSGANSKVDFYQRRFIQQTINLLDDGSASVRLGLDLENTSPTSGQPRYVIGPWRPTQEDGPVGEILSSLEAGESVALVNVYCGFDCVPAEARLNGSPVDLSIRADLGMRYTQHYFSTPSGETGSLEVAWSDPAAWDGNSSGGTYRMTLANQVSIEPTTVSILIEAPPSMTITSASPPFQIVNGVAVYEGTPGARLEAEVEFAPSLPVRLWRNVTRFLTRPLFDRGTALSVEERTPSRQSSR